MQHLAGGAHNRDDHLEQLVVGHLRSNSSSLELDRLQWPRPPPFTLRVVSNRRSAETYVVAALTRSELVRT